MYEPYEQIVCVSVSADVCVCVSEHASEKLAMLMTNDKVGGRCESSPRAAADVWETALAGVLSTLL